jgi:hypothetical protein
MAITRNSKNWLPQVCAGGADRTCYDNRPATKCRDVRFGSKADICAAKRYVRFPLIATVKADIALKDAYSSRGVRS